ncbi:MAG: magnesium transporter, partial [Firmicutes bacterium]|nr:magnesium transporter [Bacillota bacterium]
AIPVVDKENRLVGIITVDDILDVIEEETTEDIERMAGIMDDSDKEYLDLSVFSHVKSRLPWLIFLTLSLMLTGAIITRFEAVLSQVIILVSYLPLLMGSGGNTGTQAATLVIRGMAVDEIDLKDAFKVFWKELRISVILGGILSILNFAKVVFIDHQTVMIGLTVAVSLLLIIMFAKLLGGLLPMAAKRVGIDPALMASPMMASLTDMFSAVAFLLIASLFLGISL